MGHTEQANGLDGSSPVTPPPLPPTAAVDPAPFPGYSDVVVEVAREAIVVAAAATAAREMPRYTISSKK